MVYRSMTPPESLRTAADLLDCWAASGGKDDGVLNEALVEICALHDSMFESILKRKPQFAEVLRLRKEQLHALLDD
jgi:hypothetical protein